MCEKAKEFNFIKEVVSDNEKCLTETEKAQLLAQNQRLVPDFKAKQLEAQAQRHWDLFYKRNETRFFKDRRWTTREFVELLTNTKQQLLKANNGNDNTENKEHRRLFEIGCGVGNLIFPLVEDEQTAANTYFYVCDLSPRAVEFVRQHASYNPERMCAFQCDITTSDVYEHITTGSIDICTLIFVLSAIHPHKFATVISNIWQLLKPGGLLLFRDYGLYDMTQLRFKPGHKISDNFYMRQDGTRSYYFSKAELAALFEAAGYIILSNDYVQRRTLNVKEGINVPRIFLQGKFQKPFN